MTIKYNTGNPVGSADPRDLYDTATVADNLVNGSDATYPDRLGADRRSWKSVEDQVNQQEVEFNSDQSRREGEFQSDQNDRDSIFQNFIASSGYQFAGDYAAGIELTTYNQIVRDGSGEFWRVSGQVVLPYTTTGAGMPEGGAFVAVGDAALRQELDSNTAGQGSDLITHTGTSDTVTEALDKRVILEDLASSNETKGASLVTTESGETVETAIDGSREKLERADPARFYSQKTPTASLILDGAYDYNLFTMSTYLKDTKNVLAGYAIPTGQLGSVSPVGFGDPDLLRYAISLGHQLLNHGLSGSVSVKDPLSDELLEQEVDQSYRDLRRLGLGIKGWVSYFSNLNPENSSAVVRKHAIPFGEPVFTDSRDFSTVTLKGAADLSDNGIHRANMESIIDESGNQIIGNTAADHNEKVRLLKLLADYCVANNRHVVLYHHDVSNGKLPKEKVGEVIDYFRSVGIDFIPPAEQFQRISNVSVKESKIEALEADIGELFSTESENLLKEFYLPNWRVDRLSGTLPTYNYEQTATTVTNTLSFVGNSTGASVQFFRDFDNISGLTGEGGSISFAFSYRSDVADTFDVTPLAASGSIRVLMQFLDSEAVEIARVDKTYNHIDTHSRLAHVAMTDLPHMDATATKMRVIIVVTSGDGTARDVIIENPRINRGAFPARFRASENLSIINQMVNQELDVGQSWQPVIASASLINKIKKISVGANLNGEGQLRAYKEIYPARPGTHTLNLVSGDPTTLTFTIDSDLILTVDSISGVPSARVSSVIAYG